VAVDARSPSLDARLTRLILQSDASIFGDAPRILRELREVAPVHRLGPVVLVSRHADVRTALADSDLELLRQQGQWQRLCDDPSLAPAAVEELLRYVSPVQFVNRNAAKEFELEGFAIPEGQTVFLVLAAANRDPAVFSEPETLDLTRADSGRHLGFGYGFAFCLGAALARLEGEVAFVELARRFPDLELTGAQLEWQGFSLLRSLKSVPVSLGKER
jgi:cytochrome P450